ncbi:IQ domain-containing protein K isoform X2 [Microcebus murinus]|uniref:IQ domain-containing protein K isoform X2 n=1 Tax=Microcebus murinus TaxID=30608 RepID=UPI003F6A918F
MAAPPPPLGSSCTAQREEPSGSANSFAPRSLPTASSGSPELPVLPGQAAESPGKSLWEQICEEYEAEQPPFPEVYKAKQQEVMTVSPLEEMLFHGFNVEHYFPVSHFPVTSYKPCFEEKVETFDPKTCPPKAYLETFIFPVLLPGMASLLHQAKKEKCFEPEATNPTLPPADRRASNSPHSVLLESLSEETTFAFLPATQACSSRSMSPSTHLVRCDPEIQELRQWQKKLSEDKHIRQRVQTFWTKQEQKVKCKMEDEVPAAKIPSP